MHVETVRQYRGLILAWRDRPDWLRRPPGYSVQRRTRQTLVGDQLVSEKRFSRYQRIRLPTVNPLYGKGAYAALNKRCRWCKRPVDEKRRRVWHEACWPAYWAATGNQSRLVAAMMDSQQRDPGASPPTCELCGQPNDRARRLELDHRDALSVAWASGDQRRLLRALTLANLRWLCHECHAAKTGDDRRRMSNLLNGRPEDWRPGSGESAEPAETPQLSLWETAA